MVNNGYIMTIIARQELSGFLVVDASGPPIILPIDYHHVPVVSLQVLELDRAMIFEGLVFDGLRGRRPIGVRNVCFVAGVHSFG
jgi:hypothetical protein